MGAARAVLCHNHGRPTAPFFNRRIDGPRDKATHPVICFLTDHYAANFSVLHARSDRISADIALSTLVLQNAFRDSGKGWIKTEGFSHLAVHWDLDVLDAAHFSPLLFNKPDQPEGAFDGIVQGSMRLEQVVRLLHDLGSACDVVGLAIAEFLPWDMLRLKSALDRLPIMQS